MKPIIFIDTEIKESTNKMSDFGCIDDRGNEYHGMDRNEISKQLNRFSFICGHNIIKHDSKYIEEFINIKKVYYIDTLLLSPLVYPKKLYHNILKDYKLDNEEINNPLEDSKKCKDLFYCEIEAFRSFPNELKNIFANLLSNCEEFKGFFKYISWLPLWNIKKSIFNYYSGRICENVDLGMLIADYPIELCYALALINSSEQTDVIAPWVVINYPKVQEILKILRKTPCEQGCKYCSATFDLNKKLYQFFTHKEFRTFNEETLQEDAVRAAVYGKSLLAIFPTGGGKSVTFQLPALIEGEATRGLTVVISPLQSLMKDQVDGLEKKGIISAVTINGLLDPMQRREAIDRVMNGTANILYISPELLRSKTIEKMLLSRHISRFVIDEAHCFSTWGQDFRIDYLFIGDFIKYIQEKKQMNSKIPVSCFTATAKQKVISDICQYFKDKLGIEFNIFATKATRTNLHYRVELKKDDDEKYAALRDLINERKCPTIVFVSRTKAAERLANKLSQDKINALAFHGKMDSQVKILNQERFIKNEVQVMVATSAFGMGVDKDNVELVVHYDISDSLENYVQEAGRAGRDNNLQAECVVYFNENDLNKHFQMLNMSKISMQDIRLVWQGIKRMTAKRNTISCSALEIARQAGWNEEASDVEIKIKTAINALESAGYIERGFNCPKIFATSINGNIKNVEMAANKMKESSNFTEDEIEKARAIFSKLIGSKHRHAPGFDADARVDVISDALGYEKTVVITLIDKMRSIGLLSDSNDMHGHFKQDDINKSDNLLELSLSLERYLLSYIEQNIKYGKNSLNVKELNDLAIKDDYKKATVDRFKKIINYWKKQGYWRVDSQVIGAVYEVDLMFSIDLILEKIEKRADLVNFVVTYLYDKAQKEKVEHLEFSIIELMKSYNCRENLFAEHTKCDIEELQKGLLYLTNMGVLSIDGGFLILYNAMQITRKVKDNKIQYKKEDYKQLQEHYDLKIQQIHIVGEYANMMLKDYNEALTYVSDYFNMQYDGFIKKYFKGTKQGEIKRNITAKKYNELFGTLSITQKEIIDDNESQFITVLAGPGSGKTKVLVHKMASLLLLEDVKSEQLLMLTFSRAAATEFKTRLMDLIGEPAHRVEIKTFHSYCFDLLGKLGKKTTEDELDKVVEEAIEMIETNDVEQIKIAKSVIVIDEAQDISDKEFELIKILMRKCPDVRVVAVGDDDQNIYEFRKSDSRYMAELGELCEYSKTYELIENYRSVNAIVEFSNKFLQSVSKRRKENEIVSVRPGKGGVYIAKYKSQNIEELVVESVAKRQSESEKVAILTRTNEEALKVLSFLNKKGIKAKMIQSNDGINLFNLVEIRAFYDYINKDDNPIVSDELWCEGVKYIKTKFAKSSSLEIALNILNGFNKVNKSKYKTDFKEFIYESNIEDFIETNNANFVVSTLHKAKGREFDTVHLLLNNYTLNTDEEKRLLYVGMTRAKLNLIIHYNNDIFDKYKDDVNKFKINDIICDEPKDIILQLGYRDVYLGFAKSNNIKMILNKAYSGDRLVFDDGDFRIGNVSISRISYKFRNKLVELNEKGYNIVDSEIRHVVLWRDIEDVKSDEEYLLVLPTVYMSKNIHQSVSEDEICDDLEENVSGSFDEDDSLVSNNDMDLFFRLKELRKEISESEGVPAYIVFSNETLFNMVKYKPKDKEEMLRIYGVGKVKFERYGEAFLEEINK